MCGSFVIFRLDIELLLAQHIPLLGYLLLTSPWGLPYGLTEQFFRGVAMPLADTRLCSFLAAVQALYLVEHITLSRCFSEMQMTEMIICCFMPS
jgi:hypothetical protein